LRTTGAADDSRVAASGVRGTAFDGDRGDERYSARCARVRCGHALRSRSRADRHCVA